MTQANLFHEDTSYMPLAERLRPKHLSDLVGPIKKNPSFLNWVNSGIKQSAIFWGPPGTGKTTIANLAAKLAKKDFIKLYAFNSGVKELREIISRAEKIPGSLILFIDEMHNFNKSQQDILLNALEQGYLTLIAATTENPAISINKAILSRSMVFELSVLEHEDLKVITQKALKKLALEFSKEAIDYIIKASKGDARQLLKNIEQCSLIENKQEITLEDLEGFIDDRFYSGDPNTYYDCVSALQKSMRGSDANAAIYWLARLIDAGTELKSIARRIVVTASEDVGLADPQALVIAQAAYDAAMHLGFPEARIPLAQAVAYIAKAPKSNESYKALAKALTDCKNQAAYRVPDHLKSIDLKSCPAKSNNKEVNPKTNYLYPHDFPNNWVEQQYMPDELVDKKYFED